ncbi:MAG: hypothetical protein O7B81_11420 [Gammaproteobacteria bacterium]|nr:hypothetical protein [Gammaproteobacteria bacterium]
MVGAAGVIASLVYLAVQIRQNTKTVAANTFQAILSTSSELLMNVSQSPDLVDALLKAINQTDDLTQRERFLVDVYLRALTRNFENYYYQNQRGFLDDELWFGYRDALMELLNLEFGRNYWGRNKHVFGKDFARFVDSQSKKDDSGGHSLGIWDTESAT